MSTLSLGYLTIAEATPSGIVAAAGRGGFHATGARITGHRPGDAGPELVGNRDATAALRGAMRDFGVAIANISTYRFMPDTRPGDYDAVLDTMAELGVPVMVANCFTPDEGLAVANLAAVCARAAPLSIRIALEFIPVSNVKTVGQAAAMMARTGMANAGLVVDALHLQRSGGTPADVAAVDPALLTAVQLCDAPLTAPADLYAEMRGGRLNPGEGELPLFALMDALPSGIEIEAEVPHAARAGLPAEQRARLAYDALQAFLVGYRAARVA